MKPSFALLFTALVAGVALASPAADTATDGITDAANTQPEELLSADLDSIAPGVEMDPLANLDVDEDSDSAVARRSYGGGNNSGCCYWQGQKYYPGDWAECSYGQKCKYQKCQCYNGQWQNCQPWPQQPPSCCYWKGQSYQIGETVDKYVKCKSQGNHWRRNYGGGSYPQCYYECTCCAGSYGGAPQWSCKYYGNSY